MYKGEFVTETMLVQGVNDKEKELEKISRFVKGIGPERSYISIPTRPPAEKWVRPPMESVLNIAYNIFMEEGVRTELLIGYEGNAFASTGDTKNDLLSITSVHPMRESAVRELLQKNGADWNIVEDMIEDDQLVKLEYGKDIFYFRRFPSKRG